MPDWQSAPSALRDPCSEDEAPAGGYVSGLIGALLGAAVGTVPWFAAATFANLYVGWLGFLIGWAALYGYKLLRGTKRTVYAGVVIYVCSLAAIGLAYFFSNLYSLFRDTEFAAAVDGAGLSRVRATWLILTDSQNTGIVLKDLGISYVIGILGLLSLRKKIVAYTDPEKAAASLPGAAIPASGAADPASALPLPASFTVSEKKSSLVFGIVYLVFFCALMIASLFAAAAGNDTELYIVALVFAAFAAPGVYMVLKAKRRSITVSGSSVTCTGASGKTTAFSASEIGFVRHPNLSGIRIYGVDGRKLASAEIGMLNYPLLVQYLAQRGIEQRG